MGSSEMVSQIAAGITTLLFNITMMRLMGEEGVAALTIVLYAQFIFNAAYMGFSNSAAPIISFNYGRKDVAYLKKLFRYCMTIIGGSTVLMIVSSLLLVSPLLTLFIPQGGLVHDLAYRGYMIFVWNFLFSGFNIFASALFSALSKWDNLSSDFIPADIRVYYWSNLAIANTFRCGWYLVGNPGCRITCLHYYHSLAFMVR